MAEQDAARDFPQSRTSGVLDNTSDDFETVAAAFSPSPDEGGDGMSLNRKALDRISKVVFEYDALERKYAAAEISLQAECESLQLCVEESKSRTLRIEERSKLRIEEMSKKSGEKDAKIAQLEKVNKELSEDIAYYEDGVAARKAERQRTHRYQKFVRVERNVFTQSVLTCLSKLTSQVGSGVCRPGINADFSSQWLSLPLKTK
ncbi:hypothetical protein C8R44DRAFT_745572 [Mycena epipterygia]|nr:hypothetical protein C8R44DRAFT_745572 [Mycena epipterygia]